MQSDKYFHQVNGYGDEVIYYNGKTFYPRQKKKHIIKKLLLKFIKKDCEVPY